MCERIHGCSERRDKGSVLMAQMRAVNSYNTMMFSVRRFNINRSFSCDNTGYFIAVCPFLLREEAHFIDLIAGIKAF